MGAETFKAGAAVLEPQLSEKNIAKKPTGVFVLGTVAGDIHSIGKDIVATMLTAAGFKYMTLAWMCLWRSLSKALGY
jgi:trimethylamine corrinoid protein